MKKYAMSVREAMEHVPAHPLRTAIRSSARSMDWDVYFQVWPSAQAMRLSIDLQKRREPRQDDWQPWISSGYANAKPPKGVL